MKKNIEDIIGLILMSIIIISFILNFVFLNYKIGIVFFIVFLLSFIGFCVIGIKNFKIYKGDD
jgi:hypothetical protein